MSTIESVSHENRIFEPSREFVAQANVKKADFDAMNAKAAADFPGFWAKLARDELSGTSRSPGRSTSANAPFYKWFDDGELNVSYNCLDRNLANGNANRVAIIFEADDGTVTKVTYQELYHRVCRFANGLKVARHPQGRPRAHLHADVDRGRRRDAGVRAHRRDAFGRVRRLLGEVAAGAHHRRRRGRGDHRRRAGARRQAPAAEGDRRRGARHGRLRGHPQRVVYRRTGGNVAFSAPRDLWLHELVAKQADTCEPEWVGAEHPLFILYTSGSTGKPKGVQHSTGGYLLWAMLTMRWTFDIKPTDIFWCTADIGWVTGHTYIAYGPLAVGATEVVFEGVPTYPDAGAVLADDREAQGLDLLHGAHGDPRAGQGFRRDAVDRADQLRPVEPAPARHGRRADQSRGVDVVPRERRRRALSDRRHVVADRDRRPHDLAAARRDADGAGLVHAAAAGHHGGDRRRDRSRRRERSWRHPRHQAAVAGDDPHDLGRSRALREVVLPRGARRQALPRRRRRRCATRRPRTSRSWAASTTC